MAPRLRQGRYNENLRHRLEAKCRKVLKIIRTYLKDREGSVKGLPVDKYRAISATK